MSASLARTADGWWVVTPAGLVRLGLTAATTAELLADRGALDQAVSAAHARAAATPQEAVPAGSVDLLSPVTAPARVVAQAVNYRSHALDSGMDPDTVPAVFFRKASHSLTGPTGDIIRPDGVGVPGLRGRTGPGHRRGPAGRHHGDRRQPGPLRRRLVVANDVSARQIQLTRTQFYEAKSYPTFTPAGPWLTLVRHRGPGRAGLAPAHPCRQRPGAAGQHGGRHDHLAGAGADRAGPVPADGARRPAADRDTRRNRAQGAPEAAEKLAGLLPPATKWQLFFARQARNPRYLRDGDVITATIASPDGRLDLGTQHNTVIGKTP